MSTTQPTFPIPEEHARSVRFFKGLARLLAHMYHSLEVHSPCTLPKSGPAILVCNHISAIDPGIVQAACSRSIVWMMAGEYLSIGWLQPLFKGIGVIPVARGQRDSASTRAALRALSNGRVLGIFPEGRINPGHKFLPFHPGAATLADRTGASIVPAYLDGTSRGQSMAAAGAHRQSMRIRFGTPIPPVREPGDNNGRTTEEMLVSAMESLQLLEARQYRQILSGTFR